MKNEQYGLSEINDKEATLFIKIGQQKNEKSDEILNELHCIDALLTNQKRKVNKTKIDNIIEEYLLWKQVITL
jgi:hypothetical protein